VTTAPAAPKHGALHVLAALRRPKVAAMLALGFSCGLPFMLAGGTLSYWLKDAHIDIKLIGFLGWIGFAYSFQFLWAAAADRLRVPMLSRLGRRRGWMLAAQAGVGLGLAGMALAGPERMGLMAAGAGLAAIAGSTQNAVVDAWRIETSADAEELGLMTAASGLGFRIALIATESWILLLSRFAPWPQLYGLFAALVLVGMTAALLIGEPAAADRALAANTELQRRHPLAAAWDAVVGPLVAFFRAHGVTAAALMLGMIACYHLCDYARGAMGNTYYPALGLDKPAVGMVRTTLGLAGGFLGIAAGGLATARLGAKRALLLGAVLQPLAVAAFAILGAHGSDFVLAEAGPVRLTAFGAIMTFDPFCMSLAGVVLVAYMSTLTSLGYTATQFALLTSASTWIGKFLKGWSGTAVAYFQAGRTELAGYSLFYLYAAAMGVPAILLCLVLAARRPEPAPSSAVIPDGV
jgi:PAT family beta-lactamase induction signal transducer AmpG